MNDVEELRKEVEELDAFLWRRARHLTLSRVPYLQDRVYQEKSIEYVAKKKLLESLDKN